MLFRDTLLDNFDCLLSTSHFTQRTAAHCSLFFYFIFFLALAVNPRDVCVGKSHTDQHFRVTYITFLFHSDARFKFQQVVYMPKCYCYVIGLLDIHVNKHLNGCPQQIGW